MYEIHITKGKLDNLELKEEKSDTNKELVKTECSVREIEHSEGGKKIIEENIEIEEVIKIYIDIETAQKNLIVSKDSQTHRIDRERVDVQKIGNKSLQRELTEVEEHVEETEERKKWETVEVDVHKLGNKSLQQGLTEVEEHVEETEERKKWETVEVDVHKLGNKSLQQGLTEVEEHVEETEERKKWETVEVDVYKLGNKSLQQGLTEVEEHVEETDERKKWETVEEKYIHALLADLQNTITPTQAATSPAPAHHHNGHDMYRQERVEEVRTEQRGGEGAPPKSAALNNNLSELDTLLEDLNHARYSGFKETCGDNSILSRSMFPFMTTNLSKLSEVRLALLAFVMSAPWENSLSTAAELSMAVLTVAPTVTTFNLPTLLAVADVHPSRQHAAIRLTCAFLRKTEPVTNGAVNGSRPSVDSLLDELNSVDTNNHEVVEHHTVHKEFRTTHQTQPSRAPPPQAVPVPAVVSRPAVPSQASASSATKELDDLMASLSDFKVKEGTEAAPGGDRTSATVPQITREEKTEVKRMEVDVSTSSNRVEARTGGRGRTPPPRPPVPDDRDLLAVPPPRPPAPCSYAGTPAPPPEAFLYGAPLVSSVPAHHGVPRSPADDPFVRPPSGGPVKRNDTAYRWVTDATKYEMTEVVDDKQVEEKQVEPMRTGPPPRLYFPNPATDMISCEKQEKLRSPALVRKLLVNASSLQTQVDSAYARPQKPNKSPSPPAPAPVLSAASPLKELAPTPIPKEPTPSPTPPPANQLDSMLGSLASHMTEQGVTTTQKGSCTACAKPIVGQVITALGKTWHPEHFTCTHCNQELGTKNFFEREGRPYCETDYHDLFSPRCAYCNGPILDSPSNTSSPHPPSSSCRNVYSFKHLLTTSSFLFLQKCVTALDKTWHPKHFFCTQCGNTFGDEGYHERDGKPYCREDYYNMFAPKCGGCNSPIMENYISALNAQWHPECFVCRDCRQPFNGGSFFDHEGMPYCETHYHAKRGSLCAGCSKPITGRCITAMFRKYHPEHFVCSFCLKQLNKGTFKEQNDKPYCHVCFDKLFG
ncbi:Paxillin [Chionoecetes opilio]|uniref:Paxillin n=1 Tax=Chionoecetes opilio TaxID=41210 RepID=A0A8J4Y174_CHIOP|nr:Paxillin [Chionoecetes opilio]